ncbi:MAG: sporulation inhibitor of replication protein SirA [[Clostridium] spiroforme]|nr:sporulation inhibitor of replication protein SirA [Thomasclavelia spiroformis]
MVIEMNTYKIYKLNQSVKDLLEQYPEIKEKIITLQPKNVYFTKQLECLFENNDGVSDFIEYKLKQRKDYLRNKNIHIIKNELTKETMKCQVFDYYVIIEASKKSNIFLDILYQISKSYVIMDEQVRSLEV